MEKLNKRQADKFIEVIKQRHLISPMKFITESIELNPTKITLADRDCFKANKIQMILGAQSVVKCKQQSSTSNQNYTTAESKVSANS